MSATLGMALALVSPAVVVTGVAVAWGRINGHLAEKEKQEEAKQALRDEHDKERHQAEMEALKQLRTEFRDAHERTERRLDALLGADTETFGQVTAIETRLGNAERRIDRLEMKEAA